MQFKLAIYDWNGTLLNDIELAHQCVVEIFRTLAPQVLPPTLAEYKDINSSLTDFYYQHGLPPVVSFEKIWDVWIASYRRLASAGFLHVNDGAAELLSFCRDKSIANAIVSASRDDVVSDIAELGIGGFFRAVRLDGLNGWTKEVGLRETLSEFSVPPQNAFYLDDTFNGLMQAKKLGIATVGFTGGYNSELRIRAAEPDYVVHSLSEVIDILKGQAASA